MNVYILACHWTAPRRLSVPLNTPPNAPPPPPATTTPPSTAIATKGGCAVGRNFFHVTACDKQVGGGFSPDYGVRPTQNGFSPSPLLSPLFLLSPPPSSLSPPSLSARAMAVCCLWLIFWLSHCSFLLAVSFALRSPLYSHHPQRPTATNNTTTHITTATTNINNQPPPPPTRSSSATTASSTAARSSSPSRTSSCTRTTSAARRTST